MTRVFCTLMGHHLQDKHGPGLHWYHRLRACRCGYRAVRWMIP